MVASLAELTTLRLGGPPARLVEAASEGELVEAVREADRAGEPVLVLAGGSNVVVADEGFAGTVVHVASGGVEASERSDGARLTVEAGEPWDPLVERCLEEGLAGFECLSGIPGSTGATPIQNVGAYGQDVSGTIASVRVYDRERDAEYEMSPEECGFWYRSSVFKRRPGRWVVLSVAFELERTELSGAVLYRELAGKLGIEVGDRAPLGAVREAVLSLRRGKGMVIDPGDPDSVSAGSFFTNPVLSVEDFVRLEERVRTRLGADVRPPRFPEEDGRIKTSAAWLIERAGFARGYGDPTRIAISSKHTLALTNRGGGTTAELVELARRIAAGVARELGVELMPEPVFVGHRWSPPHDVAEAELVPARAEPA